MLENIAETPRKVLVEKVTDKGECQLSLMI